MADASKDLKKGDKVYIKPWKVYGQIVHAKPASEPEDGIYQVQIGPRFFRLSDLELDTTEADKAAREQRIGEKVARRDAARLALQSSLDLGASDPAKFREYVTAEDEVSKEFGLPPLFIKKA